MECVCRGALSSRLLRDGADGVEGEVVLLEGDDTAAVRALGAGVDLDRCAAVRAVDGLHGFVLLGLFRLFSDDATASERNLILYAAIPIVSSLLAFCALAVIYHREDKRRRH